MRIDRMLSIIVMLLNRERISARELAEKFEVSVRTIYRDIEGINLAGIPVVSYSGNNGGFGIMENYTIDRHLLSFNDMLSILSALKGISTTLEDDGLHSAIEKIRNLVPEEKTGEMNLHFEQMVIDILPGKFRKRHKHKLKMILDSIKESRLMNIEYRDARGMTSERTVEPMTLLLKGFAWYLFAFCRSRNDYRIFRVSRIIALKPSDRTFDRKNAAYTRYFDQEPDPGISVNLVLRASPGIRTRIEEYFDESEIDVQETGELIVRVTYPEDEWVYSMILSYGEDLEVLEPPHIKKIIGEKAKKIAALYKPDIRVSPE